MSDNFDKEAERKRLREKYEAASADREITERMSQLLLQGATMTNTHCDTCGSPIFRYQGQAFCPTCQATTDATGAEAGTGASGGDESEGTAQTTEADQSNRSAEPTAGGGTGGQPTDGPAAATGEHESVGTASTGTAELGGNQQSQPAGASAGGPTEGSAPVAVSQSLADTIVSLSERARESDDPRQAKELLEAAREAAETLSTLQGR